ncbi:MAG: amidohydrolase family protein [Acidimicrobiia bacterium]|nr:MAG: amidohydrolase family protein [Acidimicrobiia bacterium]
MSGLRLPGLVEVHAHTRDPGQTHKEDWDTVSAAALAGGFTTLLAMPNTSPPVVDSPSLVVASLAARDSRVDYGLFAGATDGNAESVPTLAPATVGLKMYLDHTYGDMRLGDLEVWWRHLENWPQHAPVAVHAEGPSLGTAILMAEMLERPVHLCHVSRRDEIRLVARAKERGIPVTCEVTPHHLFLDASNASESGGRWSVRPPLGSPEDRAALWDHLDAIDCFATDHAPHTVEEKDSDDPPPGFPGLETALGLLLGAVHEGRLEVEDLVVRLHERPRSIFGLPEQPDTWIEVDPDERWTVRATDLRSRAGWSPFEGQRLKGRVTLVVIRGEKAFDGGEVIAPIGAGGDVKEGA